MRANASGVFVSRAYEIGFIHSLQLGQSGHSVPGCNHSTMIREDIRF
jgi:hypothetical protein